VADLRPQPSPSHLLFAGIGCYLVAWIAPEPMCWYNLGAAVALLAAAAAGAVDAWVRK
jgi:ABC-type branched-subunit amino acid transport system permease subunit